MRSRELHCDNVSVCLRCSGSMLQQKNIEMHEQWTKNDTGIIIPFNFVPFNFVLKSNMSWHCFESKRTKMRVSEFFNAKCLFEVTRR